MKIFIHISSVLLVLVCAITSSYAQKITGTATSKDGVLPSANIKLDSIKAKADLTGFFSVNSKKIGKHTLTISYIGYTTKVLVVDVKEGLNQVGNIELLPEGNALGEIVIQGSSAGSQLRALSIKKNSSAIMEVLAADAIGKLPDRNAAEAVQRIQGVSIERDLGEGRYVSVRGTPIQWSATLLNGNRLPSASGDYTDRRIQMDIFPSELIEYVQLSKAITPDIEGDAIGGSINFITKAAPIKRLLNLNLAGGYNDQAHKGSYNGSMVYGDRLLNGKLGYILSGVIWDRTSANDRYNLDYNFANPNSKQSYSIADLQLRDYLARRRTIGFNGGVEYILKPGHKISAKGIYSEYLDQQNVHETYFNFDAKNAQIQTRSADYFTKLHSFELNGTHTISDRAELDWAVSTDESSFRYKDPGYPIVNFKQALQYGGLSSDGKKYLKMDSPNGVGDEIDHVLPEVLSPIDPTQMKLSQVILIQSKNAEQNKRLSANLKYKAGNDLNFKFGGKFIHKTKMVENALTNIYLAGVLGPAPAIGSLHTDVFPYNGGFLTEIGAPYNNVIINQISQNEVHNFVTPDYISKYKLFPYQMDSINNATGATKYFTGTENVYAAYLMGEYKLADNVTMTAGIRNEYNKVTFNGNKVTKDATGKQKVSPLVQDNSYNAFLPMLHLKYNATENDIVRLAYTRSFARPDFSNLNPATTQDDLNKIISRGNAALKPTFSHNFDLMAEHYFGGLGMVNFGAFYKKLSNLIYNNQSSETVNGLVYTVTAPDNIQNARLMGLEAGISKRFTSLPGFWSGFGVEANYTFTSSKVKIPHFTNGVKVEDESMIPKQAKHIFNAVLLYEKNGFMARVAGNYKGKYLDAIRQDAGPDHYRWYAQNFTVDFSASYAITPKIRVFSEINNLTNAPVRFYHGTYDRVEQAEWYSIRGQVGVSFKVF
jgi:TonB-dependent receptor